MGQLQRQRYCKTCQKKTLHARATFSGGWGIFLTIITAGLFLPVWLLIALIQAFSPWRCQVCGGGRMV